MEPDETSLSTGSECSFSDDSGDLIIEDVDWVQCAGQLGLLISQMSSLKRNIENSVAPNEKKFLAETREAVASCEYTATRLKNSVNSALAKYDEREVHVDEDDIPEPISNDPGLRPVKKSKQQRLYLAQIGPTQPKLFTYPQNNEITSSNKQNRFTSVWFSQYPFLEYSIVKDAAFCFVCQMFATGIDRERSGQNWSCTGVRKWDKMKSRGAGSPGKLSEHFSSKAHNAAFNDYVHFMSSNCHVDSLLDTEIRTKAVQLQEDKENNRGIIKLILDLCRTMGRQGISFRGSQSDADGNFTQLLFLLSRHSPKLKQWIDDKHNRAYKATYTSPQSQNEFLTLLGQEVKGKIVKGIKDAEVFSIMSDTTPDVSHKDQMSVICRYVNHDGTVHERLLDLKEVRDKTGRGQATATIQSVDQSGLDNGNIAFQSYDFTNSMSGQYNGAQAIVSRLLGRDIPYIPCQGHRSNTINEHACKASPIVSELFDTLQATYAFFAGSTKRYASLHDQLENVENALRLRNLSLTRWTARAESLQAMWISYEAVMDVLEQISTTDSVDAKGKAAATGLLAKVLRVDFVVSLMFMRIILWKTKVLTESLQKEDLNIVDAIEVLNGTIKSLQDIRNDDEAIVNQIQASIDVVSGKDVDAAGEFARLHRPRRRPRRLDENPESTADVAMIDFYGREFKEVLDTLIQQYNDNITVSLEKVKALSIVLQPPLKPNHEETDVKELLSLFPRQAPDQAAFAAEFDVFVNVVMKEGYVNPIESLADAAKEAERRKHIFPLTSRVYRLALTAPVTVAGNERTFSKLKTVKTALRNSMTDNRLRSLILLNCEKDITDGLDLDHLVDNWSKETNRRINL